MKEKFLKRYKAVINNYFSTKGTREDHRAALYVMNEYESILEEEFGMTHEEVKEIYNELCAEHYFKEG